MIKKKRLLLVTVIVLNLPFFADAFQRPSSTEKVKEKFELYDATPYIGKPGGFESKGLLRIQIIHGNQIVKRGEEESQSIRLDKEKLRNEIDIALYTDQKIIYTETKEWYENKQISLGKFKKGIKETFKILRKEIDGVQLGNSEISPLGLSVYRSLEKEEEEEKIVQKWKEDSKDRLKLAEFIDYFSPSAHIVSPDFEAWAIDLEITVKEIRAFDPAKKIIVAISPSYYNSPGNPYAKQFVALDVWEKMLRAVYKHCDGVIICGDRTNENGRKIKWQEREVQRRLHLTRVFIEKNKRNILSIEAFPRIEEEIPQKKSFSIFHSVKYVGTPDLSKYGIKAINTISEREIGKESNEEGIFIPDLSRLAGFAREIGENSPGIPVCILATTWMRDQIKDKQAMINRYEMVQKTFKKNNKKQNLLCFLNVSPTSLSMLRRRSSDINLNVESWLRQSVAPTRCLRQFADILLVTAVSLDDDMELWERELRIMAREARKGNSHKTVYAYIWTQYPNKESELIRFDTFLKMLEIIYSLFDGVLIVSNPSKGQSITWNEDLDFVRATKSFMQKYKIGEQN